MQPALVALMVASQSSLPGYDKAWVHSPGWPDYLCQYYSGLCFEIKCWLQRAFDGVLFKL